MIYLPVFGKDSEPHSSSRLLGICSTMILWTVFFIAMILLGSRKEPVVKYETIQIKLSPEDSYIPNIPEEFLAGETGSNSVESHSAAETPVQEVEQTIPVPSNQESVNTQKNSSAKNTKTENKTAKTETAKQNQSTASSSDTSSSYASNSYTQNYSSVEDQLNAQLNGTKKAAVWDESLFADTTNTASSTSSSTEIVNQDASFSGSAASSGNANQSQQSTTSSSSLQNSQVSDSTSQALSNLMNSTSGTTADRGTETKTSIKSTKTGDGKTQVQMSDGSSRTLIEPSTLAINFSSAASKTITEDHEVQIRFTINENGYVVGTISISSEALFAQIVRDEIRSQISRWRFESAVNTSQAVFTLKMIKR